MNFVNFEQVLSRFEAKWHGLSRPEVVKFIGDLRGNTELLIELCHTDLELGLKSGNPARVEFYLKEFPEIAQDPQWVVELLQEEYQIRSRREPGLQFSEYVLRFPGHYHRLLDSSSMSEADGVEENGPVEMKRCATHFDFTKETFRFSKDRMHAEGGLGNVWLAHDHELNRTVAVKEIKNKFRNHAAHESRFIQEALITSRLNHPGIAPVYGLGRFEDGRPYYAMRLVRGASLRERIREFFQTSPLPKNIKTDIEFRHLLQSFIDVCNTIEYAHSRGVIHRDIKPSNIMVGEYGETLVVDWGLAKQAGVPEPTVDGVPFETDDRWSTRVSETLANDATVVGQVVGSPGYMSPEQECGEPSKISFGSDIYGLGATLYTLLTNETRPNQIDDQADGLLAMAGLRNKVPRQLAPLLSVACQAMDHDPDSRFASPKELASNIECFLAGAPVDSHRESWSETLIRLMEKHHAMVGAATIVICMIAIVSTVAMVWVRGERSIAIETTEQAQTMIEELDSVLVKSRQENGRFGSRVLEDFETLRLKIDRSPELLTRARGLELLGDFRKYQGLYDGELGALRYYQRAFALLARMSDRNSPEYIRVMVELASASHIAGKKESAVKLGRQVNELISSSNVKERVKIDHLLNLATIECGMGNYQLAIESAESGLALASQRNQKYQYCMAADRLAHVYLSRGDSEGKKKAEILFRRILSIQTNRDRRNCRSGQKLFRHLLNSWQRSQPEGPITAIDELRIEFIKNAISVRLKTELRESNATRNRKRELAFYYASRECWNEAINELRPFVVECENRRDLLNLGNERIVEGKDNRALTVYARSLLKLGQIDEAIRLLEPLVEHNREMGIPVPVRLNLLGHCFQERGDLELAIRFLNDAKNQFALKCANAPACLVEFDTLKRLFDSLRENGQAAAARKLWRDALRDSEKRFSVERIAQINGWARQLGN